MREYEILPEHEKERRHFKDQVLDIVIWKDQEGQLYGFQLNYLGKIPAPDGQRLEDRVVTFFKDKGMKYSYVREDNRDVPTPKILEPKEFENQNQWLANYIRTNSGEIPWAIVQFIVKELTKQAA
jgi:hypothetical protein